jgi:hypothetical protein
MSWQRREREERGEETQNARGTLELFRRVAQAGPVYGCWLIGARRWWVACDSEHFAGLASTVICALWQRR